MERLIDECAYDIHTLTATKEQIDTFVAYGLHQIIYLLAFQLVDGLLLVSVRERVEYHIAHSLFVLIDLF